MSLLSDAPVGRHIAQLHRDTDVLVESMFAFLEGGLRRGHSVLIVATPPRVDQLFERLTVGKFHPQALCNSGQMAVIDPDELIERLGASPEWTTFRVVLVPVLTRLQPFGHGTRIYSDLGDRLWLAGKTDAAIKIEECWNALAGVYQFALYCGFTVDTQCENAYAAPIEELGRTHSDILGSTADDQFGDALDRASKEIFGVALTQMAGAAGQNGARKFPSGQRAMLWVKRNLPMSTAQLADKARQYFKELVR